MTVETIESRKRRKLIKNTIDTLGQFHDKCSTKQFSKLLLK